MKYLVFFLLLIPFARAGDSSQLWHQDGKPVQNSESRASIDGFGAALIVTSDADWEKKWDTPPSEVPRFTEVEKLKRGDKAWILIMFANPKPDTQGAVEVTCDIKIIRPNGEIREDPNLKGMKTRLKGPATNTFLAETVIGFVGEDTDELGEWIVEVVVHDLNRKAAVPLRTKFTLIGKDA